MTDNIIPIQAVTPDSKANIVLDASKIDLFETCGARYNYRHNLNKGLPTHQKAKALDLGSLAHEGFETYYNLLAQGIKYNERVDESIVKMRMRSSDPELSNSDPDDVNTLIEAVEQSFDYWRAEDENCLEILAVEAPFAYELFEDEHVRIIITGKIDLLVNFHGIGGNSSYTNLPIDHKTFSRDGVVLRKSNQFINYCNAVDSNYLVVNRVGLGKSLSIDKKFKRLPMSYDPDYKQDWKDNLKNMILNEYLPAVASGNWIEKPTSCNKFNRLCEYYDVCDSSGKETKAFKIQNNYVDNEVWDVTSGMSIPAGSRE